MCAESQCLRSLLSAALCEDGSVFSSIMIQIYASSLVSVMDNLRSLESVAKTWAASNPTEEMGNRVNTLLGATVANCAWLRLRSAWKQLHTIQKRVKSGTCQNDEFALLIAELRHRILEDLDDRVFYCITDTAKIDRFFKEKDELLVPKRAEEAFDKEIVQRFGNCIEDLVEASKCYIASCYTACVFHLMRVVERGLMELAILSGLNDPKPAWNNVVRHLERTAYKTEYKDLPDSVKPHIGLIKDLIPRMQAIEHAWRNRVMHVENRLIPAEPMDQPIAAEIMTSVEAFMRMLARKLPPKSI